MAQPEIGDVFKDITADVQTIVRDQIELAKLEMTPKLKRAGLGAGLIAVAGVMALVGALMLFICGGLAFTALYDQLVGIVWAFTLGFLTMAVILFVLAAILALIAKTKLQITGPEATLVQAERSVQAVTGAIEQGQANVAAIVAGTDRTPVRPDRPLTPDQQFPSH